MKLDKHIKLFLIAAAFLLTVLLVISTALPQNPVSAGLKSAANFMLLPFQELFSAASGSISDAFLTGEQQQKLIDENNALKKELSELRLKLLEYENLAGDNKELRKLLGITESSPSLSFVEAHIIGREVDNYYTSYIVNKGLDDGIELYDIVITADGVAGIILEIGGGWAKLEGICDISTSIGAISPRTRDIGILEGEYELSVKHLCRLSYLKNDSRVTVGDIIVTSGLGGQFPEGLVLGTVADIYPDSTGISRYALITPAVDVDSVFDVMIITDFE